MGLLILAFFIRLCALEKSAWFQELMMDSILLSGQVGPSPHVKDCDDSQ